MPPASCPILIVDDVASEAMTVDLLWQSLGVETVCAPGVAEAGSILSCIRPSAIIEDLVMPGADGSDCLVMIAEYAPTVPVLVLTGSECLLLKAAGEGESYGLSNLTCAAKPIDLSTLTAFTARPSLALKPSRRDLH